MGRSVFYPPPRSGTIQSVQSLMRINQPPRRRAEMHRVFLISVNVGYCRSSISRVCWAALRIASTTFLVAPPKCVGRCPAHLPSRNAGDAQASVGFFSLGTGGQTLVLQRSKSRCPQKSAVRSQSLMSRPCFFPDISNTTLPTPPGRTATALCYRQAMVRCCSIRCCT